MSKNIKNYPLRIDTEVFEKGKKEADKVGRSFNNWVEHLIKKAIQLTK